MGASQTGGEAEDKASETLAVRGGADGAVPYRRRPGGLVFALVHTDVRKELTWINRMDRIIFLILPILSIHVNSLPITLPPWHGVLSTLMAG